MTFHIQRGKETIDVAGQMMGSYVSQLLQSLSLIDHFESLTRGLIEARSLLFFTVFILVWLAAGTVVLRETKAN